MVVIAFPSPKTGLQNYSKLSLHAKLLLSAMAIEGGPLAQTRWLERLNKSGLKKENGKAYALEQLKLALNELKNHKLVFMELGYMIAQDEALIQAIFLETHKQGWFIQLTQHLEGIDKLQSLLSAQHYRPSLARLRVAIWGGINLEEVSFWLFTCLKEAPNKETSDPLLSFFLETFSPDLVDYIHPEVQQFIVSHLLVKPLSLFRYGEPCIIQSYQAIRKWAETLAQDKNNLLPPFTASFAMDQLFSGHLDDAEVTAGNHSFIKGCVFLLKGDLSQALPLLEDSFKAYRKDLGSKTAVLHGPANLFYVLALLRSPDVKHRKKAESYLAAAEKQITYRNVYRTEDSLIQERLSFLLSVQSGLAKPEEVTRFLPLRDTQSVWVKLLTCLLLYWMGNSKFDKQTELLKLHLDLEALGFHWVSAQVADLLHRMDVPKFDQPSPYDKMADWFERKEPWQRQLSALMQLSGMRPAGEDKTIVRRLVWHLDYKSERSIDISPLEQKRDAHGKWTKGRPVSLKRLLNEPDAFPFLTSQDKQAVLSIEKESSYSYYGGSTYEINEQQALPALIGHPAVFWANTPGVRVELLRADPELLVHKHDSRLSIKLHPQIDPHNRSTILVEKETPTRLRIIQITEQHRQISAILNGELTIPREAERHVLDMISAIAPLITVQSDVGQSDSMQQIDADDRIHALLLPYQSGLKLQLRVRPLGDSGSYYMPGQGSESLITELNGTPVQAKRTLSLEREKAQQLIAACPVLEKAELTHDEWFLEDTEEALELLLQLKVQEEQIKVSWPEGEKFKLASSQGLDNEYLQFHIQKDRDWFAVSGELQLDESRVLDLQKLLDLVRRSPGRFVALGENEFVALTEEFHRRLTDLAEFSERQGKTARIHPLASFVLEDLGQEAEADDHWKEHLKRLHALDDLNPKVPSTLQAELRDYQQEGFRWLSRLAHWGVGACLADDMGLGKTVQMLAILLERASSGPALVVAPTSVCTNWITESERFSPSLNILLFGPGDRSAQLANLKPFDLLIVSYGLLQQESERFAEVQWSTVVLDEAQAIKNANTLRSQAVMALSSGFKIAATGTPLENHLGELWNLFRFINPGLLGSLKQFNERYAGPIERQQDPQARHRLRRLIQPFILRRLKSQVLSELPARTEITLDIELSPEERTFYEALRRSAVEHLDNLGNMPPAQRQLKVFAEMMKLRRACCNPNLVAPELKLTSSKLAMFGNLVQELIENKHKALVFSQFVDHLTIIREYLDTEGISYQYLDGSTPIQQRQKRVTAFQAGEGDLFLISLKAGGTGLNLTAADYVIHMDPWWNPAVEDQASDRAHRMGQQRPVIIYRLVTQHTIEESIVSLHAHKRDLADSLLEGSDFASRMSTQDMISLLQDKWK
jgi:SNF2 family DNA or RNA helicase